MRAGTLRHLVEIIPPASGVARDDYNVPTDGDAGASGQVWCEIEQLKGDEYFAAQQNQAGVTTKVTLRYRSDITARHRLRRMDGRYLEIASPPVDPNGRMQRIELMCREAG